MMGDGRRSAAQSDGVIFCGAHTALVKKASSVAGLHIEHNTPWAWVLCQPAHRKLQLTTAFINDWWPHKPSNPQLRTIQRVHWEQWNCSQSEKSQTTAARDYNNSLRSSHTETVSCWVKPCHWEILFTSFSVFIALWDTTLAEFPELTWT